MMTLWGFLFLAFIVGAAPPPKPSQQVKVELEWEEIVGSTFYEVEVLRKNKTLVTTLKSPTPVMSVHLEPGYYLVRGRVRDHFNTQGEWSRPKEFLVPPKKIQAIAGQSSQMQVDPTTFMAPLKLHWDPPTGAHHYRIVLFNQDGKEIAKHESSQPQFSLSLRPGVYSYKVTPLTQDGVEGETFESPSMVVKSRPIPEVDDVIMEGENQKALLQWKKKTTLPTSVRLEYQKHFSTRWTRLHQSEIIESQWSVPPDLKPGKYRVLLWNRNRFGDVSSIKTLEFVIKPQESVL
ncbi:hypothetical protein [Bdellovibrio sp.]|uniref:hypothetical protein n=1 Tax=Bdellovibrio sp. TaxID=28201 RepID=UPI0039E5B4D7